MVDLSCNQEQPVVCWKLEKVELEKGFFALGRSSRRVRERVRGGRRGSRDYKENGFEGRGWSVETGIRIIDHGRPIRELEKIDDLHNGLTPLWTK